MSSMRSSPLAQLAPSKLQREVQLRRPLRLRRRAEDPQHAAEAPADAETDEEHCADVQAGKLQRIVLLSGCVLGRVLDLEQPQMPDTRS